MMDKPLTALRDRIAAQIARQIATGAWATGDRVPSESVLMAEFGASRMTVHHALRDLTARGIIRRQRGSGSFVADPHPYVSLYDHQDIVIEIEGRGSRHSARVVRQELQPADAGEAITFGMPEGSPLFHAIVIHHENGIPLELENRRLNPAVLPGCMEIDLEKRSLFSLLLRSRPYRQGSESVRAILPEGDDCALLGLTGTEPCLEITRRTWSPEGMVTEARLLRVGLRAALSGRITSAPFAEESH